MSFQMRISDRLLKPAEQQLAKLCTDRFASRLFEQDATLWGEKAEAEASIRLGWVDPFAIAERVLQEAAQLRDELRSRNIDRIVLCGMGGSSLGPEVIACEAGVQLTVLDSTHPDVVSRALNADLSRTAVVVSSKSGGTVETRSHAELFRAAFLAADLDPTTHMIYVTDPGSALASLAKQGYRVFLADPHVGGRFSALTAFGIVPTVLAGADAARMVADARKIVHLLRTDSPENPALQLAAAISAALPDHFVLLMQEGPDARWGLGNWVEQLVAESTGKNGVGVLPIALPSDAPEFTTVPKNALTVALNHAAGTDSHDISLLAPLGAQMLFWEVATAALGRLMGINPFDQPDVESAKVAARTSLQLSTDIAAQSEQFTEAELVERLRHAVTETGYVAVQAFVDQHSPLGNRAVELREWLAAKLGVPVALGWGPRYLHSTGQLHKGGPAVGAYVQLIDASVAELPIPAETDGFKALMAAQARGDREVLEQHGRTVLTLTQ